MPLKGVPKILTPEILHTLSSMGHGDEIVIADAHFPSSSVAKSSQCGTLEIRADACSSIPELLEAVLKFFPLDQYDSPVKIKFYFEMIEFYN
jgi:L-fucose mutarotase